MTHILMRTRKPALILGLLVLFLILCSEVSASFKYKDEPYFSAYVYGDNHVDRGREKDITVVLQNDAILRETIYYDYQTYAFLNTRSSMFTTAYNVSVEFDGTDGIKVLTPLQRFPAIQSMSPVQIPLKIRVGENVEAGEYGIKVKLSYEIIDDLFLDARYYTPTTTSIPRETQITYEYTYNNTSASYDPYLMKSTLTNDTLSTVTWYDWVKYDYDPREQTLTLKIIVEEEDVRLEIVDVEADNMVAGGKGTLTLKIKNVGEKTGENLFVVLSTPTGFTSLSTFQNVPSTEALQPIMSLLQMQAGMMGRESLPSLTIPPELSAVLTRGSYFIGNLEPGKTADISFIVDISAEEAGYYPFQLSGVYIDEYGETQQTSSVAFGVRLTESVKFKLKDYSSSVYAGSKGDYIAKISPTDEIHDLKARLEVKPPLTATASEIFLGDVKGDFEVKFKVKAISDTEPGVYPAKIRFTYSIDDKEKEEEVDAGIEVHPKMKFVVKGVGRIPAGKEETVTAAVINAGDFKVRDATARITVVDPFSTTDDTAFMGDLEPGQKASVTFKLKADSDATPKLYALNLEVKYKDIADEWVISEPEKMPVEVVKEAGVSPMVYLGLFVVLGVIVYRAFKKFKG